MKEKPRKEINDKYKWDLTDIIKDEKELNEKLELLKKKSDKILSYKGKITKDSETLYNFYKDDEALSKLEEDLLVYVNSLLDQETTNTKAQELKMKVINVCKDLSVKFSFISPELLKTPYETILKYIEENPKLEEYRFDLECIYRYQNHTLSSIEEEIISIASKAMGNPKEIFDNLESTDILLGKIKDEENNSVILTNSNYSKYISCKNRNVRKNAFKKMFQYWENHQHTVASIYKGKIKENFFSCEIRKFNSPLEQSLFSDNISKKLYTNLIETVHKNMDKMYDYLETKRKILDLDKMHWYDLYVDLCEFNEKDISFDQGKEILMSALKPLGEDYLQKLEKAFDGKWIDIYPNKAKRSGAYQTDTYNTHPFVLLNYNENFQSVSTMAHELGHAMHTFYSKKQNYVDHSYPIFLAEIASTVNEILLNEYFYRNAKTKEEKIYYLGDFLESIRTTLYRQTLFAEYEMIMHDKYQNNIALTTEEFCTTFYNLNKKYYKNIIVDKQIRYEWERIPHFYTSFYVYKYATGISAAVKIANDILNKKENALENYLEFLSSGGSDYPLNILKKIGIDMESGKPIEEAFNVFEEKLKELKVICELDN